jgi:hypothetical protein
MVIFSPHEGHSMVVPAPAASTDSSWSQWAQLKMTSITGQFSLTLWILMLFMIVSPLSCECQQKKQFVATA